MPSPPGAEASAIPATHALFELAGAVALLMWGIHMVGVGVQRAFGSDLRRALGVALRNRATAFLTGMGVTTALQSSTATALLVTSLSGRNGVPLVPALAVMLGANVGTTLITQVLSFDIAYVYPVLILLGVALARRARAGHVRDIGQAVIGTGLVLLALHLLLRSLAPLSGSDALRPLLASLSGEPLLTMGVATLFACAAHSSVAAVLLTASLAGAGLISPAATVAMVLGCNLGSALNPLLGARHGDADRFRVALGNLLTRVAGVLVALPLSGTVASTVLAADPSTARLAANVHLAFNLVTAALFLGALPAMASVLRRVCPHRMVAAKGAAVYLDDAAIAIPTVALANAAREVMRMADILEVMLSSSSHAFHRDDRDRIDAVRRMDDEVDRLYLSIQFYVGLLARETLTDREAARLAEVAGLAINLEHVGDIIEKNLMEMAAKRIEKGLRLSADALIRVTELHERLLEQLRLAIAVFLSGDLAAARRLVRAKEDFRRIEREATDRHLVEVQSGNAEVIRISALQLDITRDLKRIEAHLANSAYSLLAQNGSLRKSRLQADPDPVSSEV